MILVDEKNAVFPSLLTDKFVKVDTGYSCEVDVQRAARDDLLLRGQ